jgi:two-component system sensor histidine kinase UhpB
MERLPGQGGKTSRSAALTLQGRAVLAVLAALAVSLALGGALSVWHAKHSVAVELATAQGAGAGLIREEWAERSPQALRLLIRAFDGERHVRAVLRDEGGAIRMASRPVEPRVRPPAWFVRLFDPRLPPLRFPAGAAGTVVLSADPINEIGEVWIGFRDGLLILALGAGLALAMVYPALGRALRPLSAVSQALGRIGAGDYQARVAETGSPEVRELAEGFNRMAERLDGAEQENQRLHAQLLSLQEEERADLARDLHDDIGPYLFAVNIDAAAVRDLAKGRRWQAVGERADLIQAAVGHMQAHVRDMLGRLRPIRAVEFGLIPALEDLAAFWRQRRPEIAFGLRLPAEEVALGPVEREALYRIAQEALANAVRHGAPGRIDLSLAQEEEAIELRVRDDGRAGAAQGGGAHFGLAGMRERLAALGGALAVEPAAEAGGWSVTARIPSAQIEQAAE